ncbi:glycosyltransferase [Piscinibacter gummiphilus]|uniref:Glycosyltransferase n=1 Tax=Piscinibacter gummiphilus TaxID=946333 RepID=A0ABZ0CWW8_9BURK|nr:glycosyltransferase [Piscinibacter gummiphilus]WOB09454.1 glycosyltransferase [Piscinibacter gummiphilus]
MKIGVMGHYFVEWTGGFDFLRMTIDSLVAASDDNVEIHLLLPVRGPRVAARLLARRLRAMALRRGPNYPSPSAVLSACNELAPRVKRAVIDRGIPSLKRYCRQYEIDVLLPSTYELPASVGTPWIAYVGDFQHKHLPHFFTSQERAFRDQHFANILDVAPAVIVNSKTVEGEAGQFYPGHRSKVFSLPFSADVPRINPSDGRDVKGKFGISEPFFMVCNQFWVHKDHATAFRAFASIAQEHPNLMLVCTGEPSDPRDPEHFGRMKQLAESLHIQDKLRILGVIPKADQLGLMSSCIAVIQPTLSEGGPGGGAVFDAVGMGVRSLVSDLAVNLELHEPTVRFFKVGDDASLAEQMRDALRSAPPTISRSDLIIQGRERRKACGEVFLKAIDHAIRTDGRARVHGLNN